MVSVSVTDLVKKKVHTTFPAIWKKLLSSEMVVKGSSHTVDPIRLADGGSDVMELGTQIEKMLCAVLEGDAISKSVSASDGTHATLLNSLKQYRTALAKCAAQKLDITLQNYLSYKVNRCSVTGISDVMLNQANMMEIKHTSREKGLQALDQLIHYAALRYLSQNKRTWFITLCNTNLGRILVYKITDDFYDSGEAQRYLEESVFCWKLSQKHGDPVASSSADLDLIAEMKGVTITKPVKTVKPAKPVTVDYALPAKVRRGYGTATHSASSSSAPSSTASQITVNRRAIRRSLGFDSSDSE